jgi:PRTRC genetic system protein C
MLFVINDDEERRSDMQIQQTERVFRYSGGLVLPDPDPLLGIEAVRQVYASSHPEFITAALSGPRPRNLAATIWSLLRAASRLFFASRVPKGSSRPLHLWCNFAELIALPA